MQFKYKDKSQTFSNIKEQQKITLKSTSIKKELTKSNQSKINQK